MTRQANQFGRDFAISPDETPHPRQCNAIMTRFRGEKDPRRCLGSKKGSEELWCASHQPCCRSPRRGTNHGPYCPGFYRVGSGG